MGYIHWPMKNKKGEKVLIIGQERLEIYHDEIEAI